MKPSPYHLCKVLNTETLRWKHFLSTKSVGSWQQLLITWCSCNPMLHRNLHGPKLYLNVCSWCYSSCMSWLKYWACQEQKFISFIWNILSSIIKLLQQGGTWLSVIKYHYYHKTGIFCHIGITSPITVFAILYIFSYLFSFYLFLLALQSSQQNTSQRKVKIYL